MSLFESHLKYVCLFICPVSRGLAISLLSIALSALLLYQLIPHTNAALLREGTALPLSLLHKHEVTWLKYT